VFDDLTGKNEEEINLMIARQKFLKLLSDNKQEREHKELQKQLLQTQLDTAKQEQELSEGKRIQTSALGGRETYQGILTDRLKQGINIKSHALLPKNIDQINAIDPPATGKLKISTFDNYLQKPAAIKSTTPSMLDAIGTLHYHTTTHLQAWLEVFLADPEVPASLAHARSSTPPSPLPHSSPPSGLQTRYNVPQAQRSAGFS
jgi:hypothetical protein